MPEVVDAGCCHHVGHVQILKALNLDVEFFIFGEGVGMSASR